MLNFLDLPGENIPLSEGSVDTVVSTFTLCTIPGVADAIRGIARVLRPGGSSCFLNMDSRLISACGAGKNGPSLSLSGFLKAVTLLARDIPTLIQQGGFRIERLETGYPAQFPKCGSYYFWGVARPN